MHWGPQRILPLGPQNLIPVVPFGAIQVPALWEEQTGNRARSSVFRDGRSHRNQPFKDPDTAEQSERRDYHQPQRQVGNDRQR